MCVSWRMRHVCLVQASTHATCVTRDRGNLPPRPAPYIKHSAVQVVALPAPPLHAAPCTHMTSLRYEHGIPPPSPAPVQRAGGTDAAVRYTHRQLPGHDVS